MTDVPDALLDAVDADPPAAPSDKVAALRASCEELRDVTAEIADLESRVEDARSRRHHLRTETIPDQMDLCGVGAMELVASGNYPAVRVEVKPEIAANIAAKWDDEKKQAAFAWLTADGSGDLIKTTITVRFPREQRARALEVLKGLTELKLDVELGESVHNQTLSAWLRARIKTPKKDAPVPLDVIGGYVGRAADIKSLAKW